MAAHQVAELPFEDEDQHQRAAEDFLAPCLNEGEYLTRWDKSENDASPARTAGQLSLDVKSYLCDRLGLPIQVRVGLG